MSAISVATSKRKYPNFYGSSKLELKKPSGKLTNKLEFINFTQKTDGWILLKFWLLNISFGLYEGFLHLPDLILRQLRFIVSWCQVSQSTNCRLCNFFSIASIHNSANKSRNSIKLAHCFFVKLIITCQVWQYTCKKTFWMIMNCFYCRRFKWWKSELSRKF